MNTNFAVSVIGGEYFKVRRMIFISENFLKNSVRRLVLGSVEHLQVGGLFGFSNSMHV